MGPLRRFCLAVAVLGLAACGGGGGGDNQQPLTLPPEPSEAPLAANSAVATVSGAEWDDTAVRKVLHTFAFGGFATDAQVSAWADMSPQAAIVEMLHFQPHNQKLSPTVANDSLNGTDRSLRALSAYWSGGNSPIPQTADHERRQYFAIPGWHGAMNTALQASATPGVNPFLHRVLIWETNYHLVANLDAGVDSRVLAQYYDTLLKSFAAGDSYEQTLAKAAASAAIAQQYKHYRNFYDLRNGVGVFSGNEDFAREFHQLFFGILGTREAVDVTPRAAGEDSYHEVVTIKNTAKMLTDMRLIGDDAVDLTFGTARHHTADLEILHSTVSGATAKNKIDALVQVAIAHPESRDNLPVIIIQGLANDALTDANKAELRALWQSLPRRDLLSFLRYYAISRQFHSPERVKYWTAMERNLLFANLSTLNQQESYLGLYDLEWLTSSDGFDVFQPTHNVFGHTTGTESSESVDLFRGLLDRQMDEYWRFARYSSQWDNYLTAVAPNWHKHWGGVVPKTAGQYRVRETAEWLWQRFLADGRANFGNLERLYVYSLLATGRDPAYYCTGNGAAGTNWDRVYTEADFGTGGAGLTCLNQLATQTLALDSSNLETRDDANHDLGLAINFMLATPFAQLQVGRN